MVDSRIKDVLDDILLLVTDPSGGTTPIRYPDSYNLLTIGQATFPRSFATTAVAPGSGNMRLTYFTAWKTETSVSVRMVAGSTPAVAPTLSRVGLYTVAANGDGTLVASFANDTAFLSAASTTYTKAWTTPYAVVKGQRLALGQLMVAGTTSTVLGATVSNAAEAAEAPRMTGTVGGQADLPASFLSASVTAGGVRPYAVLLP